MAESNLFEVKKYDFSQKSLLKIDENHFVNGLWPLVYILSDGQTKEAYVGETTDAFSRMSNHLKNNYKNKLTTVHLITSDKFNKSATLDIESNLIKYLAADGQYKLLNGNLGLANHTYYQKKEIYWDIFKTIWSELKAEKITQNTLEYIDNSDLFKYSPYKSLSVEQKASLIDIIKSLLNKNTDNIVVEGGAGTGKTILAVFLFKLLNSEIGDFSTKEFGDDEKEFIKLVNDLRSKYPNPSMALIVPMKGFRSTLKKVFKNIKGLNSKMVIGPAEVVNRKFDILVVDESHRLRRRIALGAYFGAFDIANRKLKLDKNSGTELDWVIMQGAKNILFYDENQSIKPSDVSKVNFDSLKANSRTVIKTLTSQFRAKGGNDYVTYVDKLLNCKFRKSEDIFYSRDYEFILFDSIEKMIEKIKSNDREFGLSRLVAGYSWKWVSKNSDVHDIEIDNVKLKWNSVTDDFINSKNAINEVGCIHTTQGYDLNYTGLIFGNEISYDKDKNEIVIREENYFDKNGKQSIKDPEELKNYIINIYKTMLLRGIKGTYVYACDKNLRDYFKSKIKCDTQEVKSTIKESIVSPYVAEMVGIPLLGMAPCGAPFNAEENTEEIILVPKSKIQRDIKYFILRATGDSMNKVGINDGDLVLCKQKLTAHENDRVVALVGDSVTIKEFHRKGAQIVLSPRSTNLEHKDIYPDEEVQIQGIVVEVIKEVD